MLHDDATTEANALNTSSRGNIPGVAGCDQENVIFHQSVDRRMARQEIKRKQYWRSCKPVRAVKASWVRLVLEDDVSVK